MKKPNYTPGPWTINGEGVDSFEYEVATVTPIDRVGKGWDFGGQSNANQKLITAAPSLAEALYSLMVVADMQVSTEMQPYILEARKALELAGWTDD